MKKQRKIENAPMTKKLSIEYHTVAGQKPSNGDLEYVHFKGDSSG